MISVEAKLFSNQEWKTLIFSNQVTLPSQIQQGKIPPEKIQQEKMQQGTMQGRQQAMSRPTLSRLWMVNLFLMMDHHPPWTALNLLSVTIHQEVTLLLRAQRVTLRQKPLRQLVNLVWTLQEDEQRWEKTLPKLLVRLPNNLSGKG